MHDCCNVCHKSSECEDSGCSTPIANFDCIPTSECDQEQAREVSEDERACEEALNEVQRSLSSQSTIRMFDSTGIVGHGLSDDLIDTNVNNVHNICDPPHDFEAKGDSTLTTHSHNTPCVS